MTEHPFFSKSYKRHQSPDGTVSYLFSTCYSQNDTSHNELPPLAVEGSMYYAETDQLENKNSTTSFTVLPDEVHTTQVKTTVFTTWLKDCSGAFVKPPTLAQCLPTIVCSWDSNAPVASINPTEELQDWVLQWIPTKVKFCIPAFEIYWAPCYKTELARIPELQGSEQTVGIELQEPEKIYTVTRLNEIGNQDGWLQELQDIPLPYADSSTLRFDPKLELQQTKDRRRLRDARIRVKLARYRAERMAQRFEEKYGIYPEEDEEEGQTEAEQSDED